MKEEFAENWKLWQDKCCFKVISPLIWEICYEVLLFKHSIGEDWLRVVITLPCSEELVVMGEMEKTPLTQCSKTFDTRNPLPVIPTTQEWDRWRKVKVLKEDLRKCARIQFRYGDKLANCLERIFSMLPIVMRPVDRPFDSVTLIVATGREEVRRTVRLQSPIDLLEVHMSWRLTHAFASAF